MSVSIPSLAETLQPIGDRVLVLPFAAEQVTASGLDIPENVKGKKPTRGVVVAIASQDSLSRLIDVGDKVYFASDIGDDVPTKDEAGKEVVLKSLYASEVLGLIK